MPKVLPEYLELRRRQILDAAATRFASRGFHQTTMHDICEEAGLSPGAVYRYFSSKEEIIEAMCARGNSQDVETIRGTMALGGTLDIFDSLIRTFFDELDNRELCALSVELVSEARHNDFIRESLRRGWEEIRAPLADIVRRAQSRGEILPDLDADSVARALMALHQGILLQRLADPDADIEIYTQVVRSLLHGTFWRGEQSATASDR